MRMVVNHWLPVWCEWSDLKPASCLLGCTSILQHSVMTAECSGISRFGHHVAGNCQFWIANFFSGPISGRLHFREPCLHVLCQFCALFSIYMATRVDKHCALLLPQLPLIQFSWRKYQGFQWKKFIFFFRSAHNLFWVWRRYIQIENWFLNRSPKSWK